MTKRQNTSKKPRRKFNSYDSQQHSDVGLRVRMQAMDRQQMPTGTSRWSLFLELWEFLPDDFAPEELLIFLTLSQHCIHSDPGAGFQLGMKPMERGTRLSETTIRKYLKIMRSRGYVHWETNPRGNVYFIKWATIEQAALAGHAAWFDQHPLEEVEEEVAPVVALHVVEEPPEELPHVEDDWAPEDRPYATYTPWPKLKGMMNR